MMKVHVINDDVTVRTRMRRVLESANYDVVEAETGEYGPNSFYDGRIDITMADILLPGAKGIEAIAALRRHASSAWIITISGIADGDVEASSEAKR